MGWWRNIRVRWRSYWLARKLRKNPDPLREFIYLDDVSVYSLLASKSGAIPTDFTDKKTRTYTGELSGTSESSSPTGKSVGAFKAGVSHASEQQVARKAIVQSTFRDLRKGLVHEILLAPAKRKKFAPPRTAEALASRLEAAALDGLACRADLLTRGRLLEITVQLEAHDLFRAGAVIDVMGELLDELPTGLRPSLAGIGNAIALGKILDKLLVGLVPLHCRVVDFALVTVDGNEWLVHHELLRELPDSVERKPLHVVGLTERHLYWRDLRRVVFSQMTVRIMARVSAPGVRRNWSPVKLSETVSRFSPGFATSMTDLEVMMSGVGLQRDGVVESQDRFEAMLTQYAELYADRLAVPFAAVETGVRDSARQHRTAGSGDYDVQAGALDAVEEQVRSGLANGAVASLERQGHLQLRRAALEGYVQSEALARRGLPGALPEENLLECEFVAIYW